MTLGEYANNFEGLPPSNISLNARMMWDVLRLACSNPTEPGNGNGLLHQSLKPTLPIDDLNDVMIAVGIVHSPEVNVDTSDGGQSAPMASFSTSSTFNDQPVATTPNGMQTLLSEPLNSNDPSIFWLWGGIPSTLDIQNYDFPAGALGGLDRWDMGNL